MLNIEMIIRNDVILNLLRILCVSDFNKFASGVDFFDSLEGLVPNIVLFPILPILLLLLPALLASLVWNKLSKVGTGVGKLLLLVVFQTIIFVSSMFLIEAIQDFIFPSVLSRYM